MSGDRLAGPTRGCHHSCPGPLPATDPFRSDHTAQSSRCDASFGSSSTLSALVVTPTGQDRIRTRRWMEPTRERGSHMAEEGRWRLLNDSTTERLPNR